MPPLTLYSPALLDHARAPRHVGPLAAGASHTRVHNPLCGDRVDLWLDPTDPAALRIAHHTRGCAVCVAAASLLCGAVHGQGAASAARVAALDDLLVAVDGPSFETTPWEPLAAVRAVPTRSECVRLPFQALRALLSA